MLTYNDYRRGYNPGFEGSEGGGSQMLTEDAWNALPEREKWRLMGDTLAITTDDSRYGDLRQRLGGDSSRNLSLNWTGGDPLSREQVVDPSKAVDTGNGIYAISEDNFTPQAQSNGEENKLWYLAPFLPIAASMFGGGLLGGAAEGAAGATSGSGGLLDAASAAEWWGGPGAATNPSAGLFGSEIGAEIGALGSNPHDAAWWGGENAATDPGNLFGNAPGPMPNPHDAEWWGGPDAANNPSPGLFGGEASGGLLNALGSGASGLLDYAMKNPLQALGLLQTGMGLIRGGNSGGSNGNSSGPGNPTVLPKGNRGAWRPNAHTQAQINNFRFTGGR